MSVGGSLASVDGRSWSHHQDCTDGEKRPHERTADAGAWPERMPEVRYYADGSLTLPGTGDVPPSCGEWLPMEFCGSCADVEIAQTTCQTRSCPDCWYTWACNRTVGAVDRLSAAREAEPDGIRRRAVHVVASPEPGTVRTLTDVAAGWTDAYRMLEAAGVRGGVVVFHGYRVKDFAKAEFRALKDAEKVSGGVWKWIREDPRDWRTLTYWSPHWHCLGLAEDVAETDPDAADGWVVHRVTNAMAPHRLTDRSGYEDVAKRFTYLLSHVSYDPNKNSHSIRWFGDLANNAFSPDAALSDAKRRVVRRMSEEVAGGLVEEQSGDGPADERECRCEGCNGTYRPIWDAGGALASPSWCNSIGADREHRLKVAFKWAIREIKGPPGFATAKTEDEAAELYDLLLSEH